MKPQKPSFHPWVEELETRLVPVIFTTKWLGTTSSNWFDPKNWDSGVPTDQADVVLQIVNGARDPLISTQVGGTYPVHSITTAASFVGHVLELGAYETLNVSGAAAQSRWLGGSVQLDSSPGVQGGPPPSSADLTITNSAQLSWEGGNIFTNFSGAPAPGGLVSITGSGQLLVQGGGSSFDNVNVTVGNTSTTGTMTLKDMTDNLSAGGLTTISVEQGGTLDFAQTSDSDTKGRIIPKDANATPVIKNWGVVTRSVVDAAGKTFKLGAPIDQQDVNTSRIEVRGSFQVDNQNTDDWAVRAANGKVALYNGADLISSKKVRFTGTANLVLVSRLSQASSATVSADVVFASTGSIIVGDISQANFFDTLTLKSLDMQKGNLEITIQGGVAAGQNDVLALQNNCTLAAAAAVKVEAVQAMPNANVDYTFLTYGGAITGTFGSIVGVGNFTPPNGYELVAPAGGNYKFHRKP